MNDKLQQAKDLAAKEYGYESFEQFDDKSTFGYDHRTPEIIQRIAERYHALMSEWVSVNERLPEIDEEYLLYVYDEDMEHYFHSVGYFEKSTKSFNTDLCIEMKFILFWKELPQPPKQ